MSKELRLNIIGKLLRKEPLDLSEIKRIDVSLCIEDQISQVLIESLDMSQDKLDIVMKDHIPLDATDEHWAHYLKVAEEKLK